MIQGFRVGQKLNNFFNGIQELLNGKKNSLKEQLKSIVFQSYCTKSRQSAVGSTAGEDVTIPWSHGVTQHNGPFSGT